MQIFRKLPLLNILRKPVRSAILLCLTAVLSFTVFGGALMVSSLRSGMTSLKERLGADIMVIPEEAAEKKNLEEIVLQGQTGYFYIEDTVTKAVADVEGTKQVSDQIFLASLAASCCSAKVQLIGFDPETDFTVLPWIRRSCSGQLKKMEVVVGHDIVSDEGDTLTFYGTDCIVAGKLTRTGTSYDHCVFAGADTIRELTMSSIGKNLNQFKEVDPNHVVSCVLVQAEEGIEIDALAERIQASVPGVCAVPTSGMIAGISGNLLGISHIVRIMTAVILILAFLIMMIVFTMLINERKREYALLRVVGVSRVSLRRSVMSEILLICLAGAAAGICAALLVEILFAGALQGTLDMPMLMPGAGSVISYMLSAALTVVAAGILSSFWNVNRVSSGEIGLALRQER